MRSIRRLAVDANIRFRAVLGKRVRATFAAHAEGVEFFAPDVAYADAIEDLPAVLAKFGRADEIRPALAYVDQLRATVVAVPEDAYLTIKDQALARIQRDPDDWPALAVAMLLDCPIWTEDSVPTRRRPKLRSTKKRGPDMVDA